MWLDFDVETERSFIPKFPRKCVYCLQDNEHESFFVSANVDVPAHFACRRLAKYKNLLEVVSIIVSFGAVIGLWYLLSTYQSQFLDMLGGWMYLVGLVAFMIFATPIYVLIENKYPSIFEVSGDSETSITIYSFADFDYAHEFAKLNDLEIDGEDVQAVVALADMTDSLEDYLAIQQQHLAELKESEKIVKPLIALVKAEQYEYESIEDLVEFAEFHESALGCSPEETAKALEIYLGIVESGETEDKDFHKTLNGIDGLLKGIKKNVPESI